MNANFVWGVIIGAGGLMVWQRVISPKLSGPKQS